MIITLETGPGSAGRQSRYPSPQAYARPSGEIEVIQVSGGQTAIDCSQRSGAGREAPAVATIRPGAAGEVF